MTPAESGGARPDDAVEKEDVPETDLVTDVFSRMRAEAATRGGGAPSLQRPPRRNVDYSLGAGPGPVGKHGDGGGEGDGDGPAQPAARDAAGTRIPDRLLYREGIRLRRKRDRTPSPFGAILAGQVAERGWRKNIAHGLIMTKWPELVGEVVAEHAEVVEFKDGVLFVRCTSSTWATQLRLAQAQILRNIAEAVGDGVVESLHIKGPTGPSWNKGRLRVKGRGPRDTYG